MKKYRVIIAATEILVSFCLCLFIFRTTIEYALVHCKPFRGKPLPLPTLRDASCRIFYFPGLGRGVEHSFWILQRIQALSKCDVIPFQPPRCYKGHKPTWENALPFVRARIANNVTHYLMGNSFGTAVAAYIAKELRDNEWDQFGGMILENPFTSIGQIMGDFIGLAPYLIPLLDEAVGVNLNWKFTPRSFEYVACNDAVCVYYPNKQGLKFKYLILTSEKDEIVPSWMSTTIAQQLAPFSVTHRILKGANHGDLQSHPRYLNILKKFFSFYFLILRASSISLGIIVTRFAWTAHKLVSSNRPTKKASAAS